MAGRFSMRTGTGLSTCQSLVQKQMLSFRPLKIVELFPWGRTGGSRWLNSNHIA